MKIKKKKEILLLSIVLAIVLTATGAYSGISSYKKNIEDRAASNIQQKTLMAKDIDIAAILRTRSIDLIRDQLSIPSYTSDQIHTMDLNISSGLIAADLKLITKGELAGLEDAFIKAEEDYGVNPLFLIAIASLESADGTICFRPNNMFGYGSKSYSSKEECIYDVARSLKKNYLTKGGSFYYGTTVTDVNRKYAASTTWDTRIEGKMKSYYSTISKKRSEIMELL